MLIVVVFKVEIYSQHDRSLDQAGMHRNQSVSTTHNKIGMIRRSFDEAPGMVELAIAGGGCAAAVMAICDCSRGGRTMLAAAAARAGALWKLSTGAR